MPVNGSWPTCRTTTRSATEPPATGSRRRVPVGLLAAGAALVLCGPFTPMLFMGEEWAASTPWQFFTDFDEPELAAAVRTGRREEFAEHGWDPGDDARTRSRTRPGTASVLDWTELGQGDHGRLSAWYRSLIALRRSTPDLRTDDLGQVHATYDEGLRWFALTRGAHLVVVNLGDQPVDVPLRRLDAGAAGVGAVDVAPGVARLPGQSAAVLGPGLRGCDHAPDPPAATGRKPTRADPR